MTFSASVVLRAFRKHCNSLGASMAKGGWKRNRRASRRFFIEELESRLAMAVDVGVVKDINVVPVDSWPTNFVRVADSVMFVCARPGSSRELWKSDTTTGGTSLVREINGS